MTCNEGHDDDDEDHDDYEEGALSEGESRRFAQDARIIRLGLHRRFITVTSTSTWTTIAEPANCV